MDFVAIDFETANEKRSSPCSLGVTVIENGIIKEEKYWLIKPKEVRFSPMNIWIHGIREEDVENEKEFHEIWHEVRPYIEGRLVVAHNASFDISVLRSTLDVYNIEYPEFQYGCTVTMAKNFYPNLTNHKLNTVCKFLNYEFRHHHAGADATAAAHILLSIINELKINSKDDLGEKLGIKFGSVFKGGYKASGSLGNSVVSSREQVKKVDNFLNKGEYFKNKNVVFTGPLKSLTRGEAMALIHKAGGFAKSSVSRKVDVLITNVMGWDTMPYHRLSNKMKRTRELINEGKEIAILCEEEFLKLLKR